MLTNLEELVLLSCAEQHGMPKSVLIERAFNILTNKTIGVPTLSKTIDRMVTAGFLERTRNQHYRISYEGIERYKTDLTSLKAIISKLL